MPPRLDLFRGRVRGWKFNEINLIFNIFLKKNLKWYYFKFIKKKIKFFY
jgi:hypothetical protein